MFIIKGIFKVILISVCAVPLMLIAAIESNGKNIKISKTLGDNLLKKIDNI